MAESTELSLPFDDEWLTVNAAAERIGRPRSTVRRWAAQGKVRTYRYGKLWVILASSLPEPARPDLAARLRQLIEAYQANDNAVWIGQVPYLVRTQVVAELEDLL